MCIINLSTNQEIRTYLNTLESEGIKSIALDIEGEFNLHCYGEHLCLVQIFDGVREVIIDPISNPGLTALGELFSSRGLLKIMYDSSSDAALIQHKLGVRILSILDLRPAVTLLGYQKMGLSSVLEEEFAMQPVKKKKFQQYNWMRRPISPEALDYALNDVRELFRLKERLFSRLIEADLLDSYILQNLYIQNGTIKPMDKDRYKKAKGYSRLPAKRKPFYRDLFIAREQIAKKANKPPNMVFPNQNLIELAQFRNPASYNVTGKCGKHLKHEHREILLELFGDVFNKHQQNL